MQRTSVPFSMRLSFSVLLILSGCAPKTNSVASNSRGETKTCGADDQNLQDIWISRISDLDERRKLSPLNESQRLQKGEELGERTATLYRTLDYLYFEADISEPGGSTVFVKTHMGPTQLRTEMRFDDATRDGAASLIIVFQG